MRIDPQFLRIVCLLAPLYLSLQALPAFAQQQDTLQDIAYLLFLMNLDVEVASAREEKSSDAPGTVTAYSAEDIKAMGVSTIGELADFTPGYSTGYLLEDQILETRGATASLNEKHLVLLDGIPVNNTRNNKAPIQEDLPLLFVQRAELLRGPASALYGIGAFNGVINLIPKSLVNNGTLMEGRLLLGAEESPDHGIRNREGTAMLSKMFLGSMISRTNLADFQLSLGYSTRPASLEWGRTADGLPKGPYRNNSESVFGRFATSFLSGPLSGVSLGFIYMSRLNGYGEAWYQFSDPGNSHRWYSAIPYLRHTVPIRQNVKLSSYLKANISVESGHQTNTARWWGTDATTNYHRLTVIDERFDTTYTTVTQQGAFSVNDTLIVSAAGDSVLRSDTTWYSDTLALSSAFHYSVQTNNFEYFSKLSIDITDEIGVLIGINYDARYQDSSTSWVQHFLIPADRPSYERLYDKVAHTWSGFIQARGVAPVLKGLILTGGVRLDNGFLDDNTYHQPSPRAAAVLRVTDALNVKAMYATALQAPSHAHLSHNREKQVLLNRWNVANRSGLAPGGLKPEIIQTVEGNLTFARGAVLTSASVFYNHITNSILREYIFSAQGFSEADFFHNADGTATARGVELESRFALATNLHLWLNGSYTTTTDNYGRAVSGIPQAKANAGINYRTPFGLSVFAAVKGIFEITRSPLVTPSDVAMHRDNDPGFAIVDLMLRQSITAATEIECSLRNITNTQYYSAEGAAPMPDRSMRLGIAMSFK